MRKIALIAAHTIRAAIRSRVVAAAAAAISVLIIALPFALKGDGTPQSLAGIFVNYAFGLLMFVTALTATWCGAGAISFEVGARQIQLLVTKPLKSFQIWAGKLLGLMAVNFILLALGGVLIYAMIHWMLASSALNRTGRPDEGLDLLTVYRAVSPLKLRGAPDDQAGVGPGQTYRWRFDLVRQTSGAQPAVLKYRLMPSPFCHQTPVAGVWRASSDKQGVFTDMPRAIAPNMTGYLNIPVVNRARFINLEYQNTQTDPAVTVFFPGADELCLLIPEGSFEANILRGLIIGFARLAFFTSLGMIAGTLFAFPVAVFASLGLLVTAYSGGFVRQLAERGLWTFTATDQFAGLSFLLNAMVRALFRFLALVLAPLESFDPLAFLPDNLIIPWSVTGLSVAVLCCLYPFVLLLIGAWCLNRREVGLSSE